MFPMDLSYPDYLDDVFKVVIPVGSRVTCDPPPLNTDFDLLCLVDGESDIAHFEVLVSTGWEMSSPNYGTMKGFRSWRKEHYNLIVTTSEPFFDSFMEATEVCKKLNLLDKKDRIAKFDEIFAKNAPPKKAIPKSPSEWKPLFAQTTPQMNIIDDVQQVQVTQQAIEQLMATVSSFNWATGGNSQGTITPGDPQW